MISWSKQGSGVTNTISVNNVWKYPFFIYAHIHTSGIAYIITSPFLNSHWNHANVCCVCDPGQFSMNLKKQELHVSPTPWSPTSRFKELEICQQRNKTQWIFFYISTALKDLTKSFVHIKTLDFSFKWAKSLQSLLMSCTVLKNSRERWGGRRERLID